MTLLDSTGGDLPNTTWIQLSNGVIEGLPLTQQIRGGFVTEYTFRLRAEDVGGASIDDIIVVQVYPQPVPVLNFLSIFVDTEYLPFSQDLLSQLLLVTLLSTHSSGEAELRDIYVGSFAEGSVLVTYSNLSINSADCAEFREWVAGVYRADEYDPTFIDVLRPFTPTKVPFVTGPCSDVTVTNTTQSFTQQGTIASDRSPTLLLAILVPTSCLALLCLLAALLTLALYRRRRSERKLLISDSMDHTFLHRRPVILPRELDLPPRRGRPVVIPGDPTHERHLRGRGRDVGTHPLLLEEEVDRNDDWSTEEAVYEPVPSPLQALPRPLIEEDPPPEYTLPPLHLYSYVRT